MTVGPLAMASGAPPLPPLTPVTFSHYLGDMAGQVFVFFILTVAAAESAIGLAILVVLFRNRASINVQELDTLKG